LEGLDGLVVSVPADSTYNQRVYLIAGPQDATSSTARTPLRLWVEDLQSGERAHADAAFNGREP